MKIIMLRILSIQSHVTFGHVGNSAVTFPLQILGHDVWPVPTAVLSNHAGYRELGGEVLSADTVQNILDGL
ncbi:MAG: pyridoxal kinase, partial [Alphaproteobacteria bacterium]|nr:pyridoxal kinase [Alphaproteobacteria bacterium]